MGDYRPVKTTCWVKFLIENNCKYKRTKASHDHYKCPNCLRSITHREKDKEIPSFHINTNLETMGISKKDFWKWVADNC